MRCCALILVAALTTAVALTSPPPASPAQSAAPSVVEAGIPDLRRAMDQGRLTSRAATEQYLARIGRYEARLNAAITISARALADADARDRERRDRRARGPLHGIPIALKDNIQTLDMPTTGGALAFAHLMAPYEATLVTRLREAGAVILAKTTMTELANWVSPNMPAGYNALVRYSFNPYDPRSGANGAPVLTPGGSSSGTGTAASFWAANVGTETSGSILNPASQNMLVGIKPTVGRISRYGVIPITADMDTPGPLARTVEDAAILLGAMEGAAPDPKDPATRACTPPPGRDYTRYLRRAGLQGARIGIPRAFFSDRLAAARPAGRQAAASRETIADAIDALTKAGATIVDPAELPSVVAAKPSDNLLARAICSGPEDRRGRDQGCSIVLKYGMKRDFNRWLASLGRAAPVASLTALRQWNRRHAGDGAIEFGQALLDISDEMDVEADRARYLADRAVDVRLAAREGIDAALAAHKLDALLFPAYFGSFVGARAGYPSIIVPFGGVADPSLPSSQGPGPSASPFGITFTGPACSEPRLIELAYAFEQATRRRVPPGLP